MEDIYVFNQDDNDIINAKSMEELIYKIKESGRDINDINIVERYSDQTFKVDKRMSGTDVTDIVLNLLK
jgi:hypothetical protein